MKAVKRQKVFCGTPSKTTLPLRLTNQTSANLKPDARFVFRHHYLHRLGGDDFEFILRIVESLERDGGLALCAAF